MSQRVLMLGAGFSSPLRKFRTAASAPDKDVEWCRLDINPDCKPDIVMDLNLIETGTKIPVADDTFDEIHAYEVMEHYGRQGDHVGFFSGMRELWRILKPEGLLIGTSPKFGTPWTWGDPGHTRVIQRETMSFLERSMYETLGVCTTSDYRKYIDPCWWKIIHLESPSDTVVFGLRKSK